MALPVVMPDKVDADRGCHCFHCDLPVPLGFSATASIEGRDQPMCCYGCQAVANAIVAAGHEHFYRVRTEPSPTGSELLPQFLRESKVYDDASVQQEFVSRLSGSEREASLILEGITCAACVWLNEQHIGSLKAVLEVQVNYSSRRAWVRWDDSQIKLSDILQAIRAIGYQAHPYNPDQQQALLQKEHRAQVRRLAVAGLFGMQVMMLSISLYVGAWSGMEQSFASLFRWVSMGLTLPVLLFSAVTFFRSAWYDLLNRRVGMDVPVAIGLGIAFTSSVLATISGEGEVYFDSLVMFVFLLLVSRYFEWVARQRSAESVERLAHALPLMANRFRGEQSKLESIAASMLAVGDTVLVRPGETVPADGVLVVGETTIDESLLNGESLPLSKTKGDRMVGGSINIANPVQVRIESVGSDTVLANIHRMIDRAQAHKPPIARLADRIASRFIIGVLTIATLVAVYWWFKGSELWLEVTLAVLIVTCPCALSLATPTAISAVLGRLQSLGLMVKRAQAIDALDRVTHVVFDKTGTLTSGKPVLAKILSDDALAHENFLKIAASLEFYSEHPLAQALVRAADLEEYLAVENVLNQTGSGLTGYIDGVQYAIGSFEFIEQFSTRSVHDDWLQQVSEMGATAVVLASRGNILCLFILTDNIRSDAASLVEALKADARAVILMTGDGAAAASRVADEVGIDEYHARLLPEDKMSQVQALQANDAVVLMVGDGLNDAPVLSSADVSIAMGSASSLAKTSADIVMLANRLDSIFDALRLASKTQTIVKQNLGWALAYNVCAIPAAAAGFITPWMAAIGMSVSSLIVVLNALRLTTGHSKKH
ncbi:MAG: heavy metal translocating P-type ATPase [Gammaproteobacteria bacterium]|nr:heavy metal translocating P-type ATPase [Gammaproteobacteria bacterium]